MSDVDWSTNWNLPPKEPAAKHKIRVCFLSGMWVEFDIDDPKSFPNIVNTIRSAGMMQMPTIYIDVKVIAMIVLIGPNGKPVTNMEGTAFPTAPLPTAPGSETAQ